MYGLETIRGSMHYIDFISKRFTVFFTIDWSQFDQRIPRVITDLYYTEFLESLIVISHGYQPTWEYPTYPDLTEDLMFKKTTNLLYFLRIWYNNMTYVTADGYAYRRTTAGVPSGLLNTQYLDSFANLVLLFDGLIEYGYSDEEIEAILLFVMGDDNSGMTTWSINQLDEFITWYEAYALSRWNMILSKAKSTITQRRSKIEMLSYSANFGSPRRSLHKLIAQLCYPERGPKDKYTSYRAIGLAYAAPFEDPEFYELCSDIYHLFKPFAVPFTAESFEHVRTYLPGYLRAFDIADLPLEVSFADFPSMQQVQQAYSKYLGPLNFAPKWNYAHFMLSPDASPPDAVTILDYRIKHKIPCPQVPTLPTTG